MSTGYPTGANRVRMAMIGGGPGSFIGPVHRKAAALDGLVSLCAGAFSPDPERNRETSLQLGLPPDRIHEDYEALLAREADRPAPERPEFVAIVTPNHLHAPIAAAALARGFAVLCEKPLARNLAEARDLQRAVESSGAAFAVTYTYLGYPLVHEARSIIASGGIGAIRRVVVNYTQGWLAQPVERHGNRQAAWRTSPETAGVGGALGDIGVHAQSLAEFVTGSDIAEVSADIRATFPERRLDDDGAMLLRFADGARGTLIASQICAGDENRLDLRVYGERGALHWTQESPNHLWHRAIDGPARLITANPDLLSDGGARAMTRLPGGHPEGYIEAFANLYRAFVLSLRGEEAPFMPGVREGVRSMAFIEAAIASSRANGAWQPVTG
ncbi:Gfo/Idh/MocA family oxidoreductase [Rhizorhapis sp.]|uniref:Gfo/Idh/MocA family protein n=1 Tax=Rhizorhapis sp. TaxID=1968842 RepID=UPI002B45DCA1|nr:Gfo/Idh/MocA family oxidoreductase [Rhizorhapis sp.]HKR16174.1 Gfo/Idh/MocA family oxidoreductase [Rhizorhapis sp.]